MRVYIAKRLLWAIPTFLGVAFLVFFLMRILPGDVARMVLGGGESVIRPEEVAKVRAELGIDRPLYVQFVSWLWEIARLDLGNSLWTGKSVASEIGIRLPITLNLVALSVFFTIVLAIPIGLVCALRQDTWIDYALRIVTIAGISIPSFWFGILVILFLVSTFGWYVPLEYATFINDPATSFKQLIFPALTLGYRETALAARMMRSCTLEVIREDYIRTAKAKGLREKTIIWGHAFRNAVLPVVSLLGIQVVLIFSGVVIIEMVFNVHGVGSLLIEAIKQRDFPLIQGIVMLIVAFVLVVNLVVDIIYAWLDPRIRYR